MNTGENQGDKTEWMWCTQALHTSPILSPLLPTTWTSKVQGQWWMESQECSIVTWAKIYVTLRLNTMQSQPKLRSCQRGQHLCITCLGNTRSTLMLRNNNIILYYLYHRLLIELLTCNFSAGLQKATVTMFRIVHTPCVQCLITARLSRYVYL